MSSQVAAVNPAGSSSSVVAVDIRSTVAQVAAIQEVMKAVMKSDTHYGVIPGTKQPSLYKAGSEALLSAFRISVEPEVTEERTPDGHIHYTVRCIGRHQTTGIVIGIGVGRCSTSEEKYQWRSAICTDEYEETPETHKRKKWNKGYQDKPAYAVFQIRTNPADQANTALKMAKKRAQIDMCLTALAASDIFTQDVEDLPPEYLDQGDHQSTPKKDNNRYKAEEKKPPQGSQQVQSTKQITEGQSKMLFAKCKNAGKDIADVAKRFEVDDIKNLTMDKMNDAIAFIEGKLE